MYNQVDVQVCGDWVHLGCWWQTKIFKPYPRWRKWWRHNWKENSRYIGKVDLSLNGGIELELLVQWIKSDLPVGNGVWSWTQIPSEGCWNQSKRGRGRRKSRKACMKAYIKSTKYVCQIIRRKGLGGMVRKEWVVRLVDVSKNIF